MANVNKWMAIGRVCSDPEIVNTQGGLKIFKCRFATVGSRRKDDRGQWVERSTFIDLTMFNRAKGQALADFCEKYLRKGVEIYIEGRLMLDQWTDQRSNEKRSKHLVEVDAVQLLGGKPADSQQQSDQQEQDRVPTVDDDVPF